MTNTLIYHDVVSADERDRCGFPGPASGRYKLAPGAFDAHLDAIAGTGLSVGLLRESPKVALTFDDGGSSALDAARALEQRGWHGHFFITTSRIGTAGFLTSDQVRALAAAGHEVGSHSDTHPTYMASLPRAQIAREWRRSREFLADLLGEPPASACVPGGFVSDVVIEEAARAGYEMLLTSKPTATAVTYRELVVRGRYAIWATTSARRAAAYARGDWFACRALWLAWHGKNVPKRISPTAYEAVRQAWTRRRR